MKKFIPLLFTLFILPRNSHAQTKSANIKDSTIKHDSILFITSGKSIFFNYSNYEEQSLKFKHIAYGYPDEFLIKHGSPNGEEFLVFYKGKHYAKQLGLLMNYDNFDESDDFKDGYFCQASFHDFNNDGNDELIISIGNGNDNTTYILQYKRNIKSTMNDFNDWKILSAFQTENKLRIVDNMVYKLDKNNVAVDSLKIGK